MARLPDKAPKKIKKDKDVALEGVKLKERLQLWWRKQRESGEVSAAQLQTARGARVMASFHGTGREVHHSFGVHCNQRILGNRPVGRMVRSSKGYSLGQLDPWVRWWWQVTEMENEYDICVANNSEAEAERARVSCRL